MRREPSIDRGKKMFRWGIPHFASHTYFDRGRCLLALQDAHFLIRQAEEAIHQMRTELAELPERTLGVYGLGGVGKTQLVLKYIQEFNLDYTHIFFVVADNDIKLSDAFRDVAIQLGIVDEATTDLIKCREATKSWLCNHDDWLLVLDNADEPYLLKNYLPSVRKGTIITTSRPGTVVSTRIFAGGLELSPLSIPEGATFLLSRLNSRGDNFYKKDLAYKISQELGGHPLALSTMAAYILECGGSLDDFLKSYRDNRHALIDKTETVREASFDYELSFATCWAISMSTLKGHHSGDLMGILALLDPDLIQEDIVKGFADHKQSYLIPALQDPFTYLEASRALRRHALVQQPPGSHTYISVHRLVQDAEIRTLEDNGTLGQAFDNAVLCVSRLYPRQLNGESMSNDFDRCKIMTPHLLNLERTYTRFFSKPDQSCSSNAPKLKKEFGELIANGGWYLYEIGNHQTAAQILSTGEAICAELFRDNPDPLTALIFNNISVIHDSQHRPLDALEYTMRAMKIREVCLEEDDPEMGNSYSNYGHSLHDLERFEEAQKFYEKTLAIHEKSIIPSDDLLEGIYTALGMNLAQMDRLEESEKAFEKAIARHPNFKSENFFVALTIFLFGSLRMKQGRWAEAETLHRRSLNLRLSLLGESHQLVGVSQHHLAFICCRRGALVEAIKLLRDAIAIFRVPSQTEPGLIQRSMLKLASILRATEYDETAFKEALDLESEAASLYKQDPSTANRPFKTEKDWNAMVQVSFRCW